MAAKTTLIQDFYSEHTKIINNKHEKTPVEILEMFVQT